MNKNDLIYKRTARRIIESPRSREQMLSVLDNTPPVVPETEEEAYERGYTAGQMAQRKKGTWIYGESEIGNDGYYCSVCGNFVPWKYGEYDIDFIKEFLFCNKCGADMGEEPEDIPMEYFESGGR